MTTSEIFDRLLTNLKLGNSAEIITSRRDETTKVLNKDFRLKDGCTDHRLMVGSFGRHTAIKGVSDLYMIYILPQTYAHPTTMRMAREGFSNVSEIFLKVAIRILKWLSTIVLSECSLLKMHLSLRYSLPLKTKTGILSIPIPLLSAGRSPNHVMRFQPPENVTTALRQVCATLQGWQGLGKMLTA